MSSSKTRPSAVGPAVQLAPAGRRDPGDPRGRLLVVNWNVHVGHGDVPSLVQELSRRERAGGFAPPHFVLLLQETFRRGEHIPDPGRVRVPRRILPPAAGSDIVDVARQLDWWMYYAPSMRNGRQVGPAAEDRGNAILSSLSLQSLEAVELPSGVQRRVALIAAVQNAHAVPILRVAVMHLDTRARLHQGWVFGGPSARNRQARIMAAALERIDDDGLPLILGGDLNTHLGAREAAVETMSRVVGRRHHGTTATHRSGLILDYVFARMPQEWQSAVCTRMDSTFGSDHYPLVLPLAVRW